MPADPIRNLEKLEEIKANLRYTDERGRRRHLRDYALFCCGINWALRVSDLRRLTVDDVFNGQGLREWFRVRQTKTRRSLRVPITNNCRDALSGPNSWTGRSSTLPRSATCQRETKPPTARLR